mmetsp:Transcript_28209/g.32868  ORF Transcript_28209/g.32868 Transcript_28209/m.32868 type:complete len:114 (-) Transcript_28209:202-543(-)
MTLSFDRDEPARVHSLKHVGETLRNRRFCSHRREKKKNDQNSVDVDTTVDTVSTSDDFNETGVMNKKSVSFCDLVCAFSWRGSFRVAKEYMRLCFLLSSHVSPRQLYIISVHI